MTREEIQAEDPHQMHYYHEERAASEPEPEPVDRDVFYENEDDHPEPSAIFRQQQDEWEEPAGNFTQHQGEWEEPSSNFTQQQDEWEEPSANFTQPQDEQEEPSTNIAQQEDECEKPSANFTQQEAEREEPSANYTQQQDEREESFYDADEGHTDNLNEESLRRPSVIDDFFDSKPTSKERPNFSTAINELFASYPTPIVPSTSTAQEQPTANGTSVMEELFKPPQPPIYEREKETQTQ
jgi:hypothetical protein